MGDPFAEAFPPRDFPTFSSCNGEHVPVLAPPTPCLFINCFCASCAGFLSDGGCMSGRLELTREDLRLPFSMNDVGPSAPAFFQGGDGAREMERRCPPSFRFFDGGPSGSVVGTGSFWSSEGIESRVAGSIESADGGCLWVLGSGWEVTRSSWWEVPFAVPFCMSR